MKVQRNHRSPRVLSVRSMTEADLEYLRQKAVPQNVRLRDIHHHIARHFASGMKLHEVARVTGYSIGRLGYLHTTPAMKDLIAHYQNILVGDWREGMDHLQEMAVANMTKAERQISEHLDRADEEGELLPVKDLLAITSDRMDRFGYGKKSQQTNINIDFAARLEAAINRTKKIAAE